MAFRTVLVVCASALLLQSISAQCNYANVATGSSYGLAGYGGLGLGAAGINLGAAGLGLGATGLGCGSSAGLYAVPTSGGGFAVSSASPISPSGLYVVSENVIEGPVTVSGALPFLSAVALEGQVASAGSSGVQYSCGNGNVGIVSENAAPAAGNRGYGAGLGYGSGLGYGQSVAYGAGAGLNAGYGLGAPLAGATLSSSCGCGAGIGVY